MNPLLLTITFLTLMSILTSSEVARFAKSSLERHLYNGYLHNEKMLAKERITTYMEELADEKSDNKQIPRPADPGGQGGGEKLTASTPWMPSPLNFNEKRPPDNSRLNFYDLLNENQSNKKKLPSDFSHYEIAARMMRRLYGDHPFFQSLANAEYKILDRLIEHKDEASEFVFPDELASIDFQDRTLQEIFYQMMKGGGGVENSYPSLLNYISFHEGIKKDQTLKRKRMNFLFASHEIIEAIFPDRRISDSLLKMREEKIEWIFELEKKRTTFTQKEDWPGRSGISEAMKKDFMSIIQQNQCDEKYVNVFDFTFGSAGHILFLKDPISGVLIREKYKGRA